MPWNSVKKLSGVSVLRRRNQLAGWLDLDYLASLHDCDAIADLGCDMKVVGDEQHREIELALEFFEHFQHLFLDRNVQSGNRLICNQHIRFQGESSGKPDTLALAAGEFVRKSIEGIVKLTELGAWWAMKRYDKP